MHSRNYFLKAKNSIRKLCYVINRDDATYTISYGFCEVNLMIIYMLLELQLTWHHNRNLSNLQRHNKTSRTTMCNYDARFSYFLLHLSVWKKFMPLTILGLIRAETSLHDHIFINCARTF